MWGKRRHELQRAVDLLARYRHCAERSEAADNRARLHPGTHTGDKELALADRWQTKAEAAWDEATAIINRVMEG